MSIKWTPETELAARNLLRLVLYEEWWDWNEGDFSELMEKAGIATYVEYDPDTMADLVADAEEGDMVYLLKPDFRVEKP